MPKVEEQKKKVFLCYAREDQPLMDDFYYRFKNYNEADLEILYDHNPEHKNMHAVFEGFARECDIAILIVNARFINPESYANKYEIPILLERKESGQVIVVGIRFTDVPFLEGWNKDGDFYFFSLTNNDLPYTLGKKKGDKSYEKEFVNYEQIDEKDLNSFHSKLRVWMIENLKKTRTEPTNLKIKVNLLRPQNITDEILKKLSGSYFKIEKILSMDDRYWQGNTPRDNDWNKSLGSIYFGRQIQVFTQIQKELESYYTSNGFFLDKLKNFIPNIEEPILDLRLLIEMSEAESLHVFNYLQQIENCIELIKKKLLLRSNSTASEELKNILFPQLKGLISQFISNLNDSDNEFKRMTSK